MSETRHVVPYFSQWESADLVPQIVTEQVSPVDDPRWADSGAADPLEYAFWSFKACGMACLRMILAARGDVNIPPTVTLAKACAEYGGYVVQDDGRVDGLIYAPFAAWVRDRFGLPAQVRAPLPVEELIRHVIGGGLAIVSVHFWIRWPDREPPSRGGHLVLVTGASTEHLLIHNPSGFPGTSQQYHRLTLSQFARFYSDRGMLIGATAGASADRQRWLARSRSLPLAEGARWRRYEAPAPR